MALISENNMRLSSYTHEFIKNYEAASAEILSSNDTLNVYQWVLRRVTLNHPSVAMYTTPVVLALHKEGRLYRYKKGDVCIEVSKGDTLIDAGIGWGDTTIYLAQLADAPSGGHSYAFDILEQGIAALGEQLQLNPAVKNITPILGALSDKDGEKVNISPPSPGASIVYEDTGSHALTITIDQFVKSNDIKKIDFIKMDIEGAEVPALKGAVNVIKLFKPKLAISAYHKWDDLLEIPMLINNMRSDYNYYLDCTTGFGGEAVLYCK